MRAITVKGYKKTGKTTTVMRIIEELVRRGYSVGSSKDTHFEGFAMDQENTDSWRHAKAGASTVTIVASEETDVLFHHRRGLSEIISLFEEDFLVSEGEDDQGFPNIITGKSVQDLDARRDEHTIGFSGIISSEMEEYDGLPVIDATRDIGRLVDLIEEKSAELSLEKSAVTDAVKSAETGAVKSAERSAEMKEAGEKELVLKFNGEDVPMVPFVESILKETVLGLVKSLKGYEEGMDVTIELKEK